MKPSLGILLPVHNAQHGLTSAVIGLLDVLPEWSERFELVIIDDGSTDDTAELARELAFQYPQLRILRHPVRLGLSETIQTGLDEGKCEMILIGNDAYELDPDDLRLLWQLREAERRLTRHEESVVGGGRRRANQFERQTPRIGLDQRLGFQTIRRATFEQLRLAEAIDAIARIDAANRTSAPGARSNSRPNFLGKLRRFTTGQ